MNKATRDTEQRRMILEYLTGNHSHPTAIEVYDFVKKSLPYVSLSTIYRNLEILKSQGKITKIETTSRSRFDCNAWNHAHIRCQCCGRVEDIDQGMINLKGLKSIDSFDINGLKIEIVGICKDCSSRRHTCKLDRYSLELIMALASLNGPASCKQIALLAGRHSPSVNGKLKNLCERGLVAHSVNGLYNLTEKGFNYLKEEK